MGKEGGKEGKGGDIRGENEEWRKRREKSVYRSVFVQSAGGAKVQDQVSLSN